MTNEQASSVLKLIAIAILTLFIVRVVWITLHAEDTREGQIRKSNTIYEEAILAITAVLVLTITYFLWR